MKTIFTLIAASSLFAVLATAQPPRPRYTVKDLGTFGGPGTNSAAYDMNNAGWVAGSGNLTPGGPQHAFLWYGGGPLKDLGTLGGPNSEAGGPNAFGEAALISETSKKDPNGEDFCGFGTNLQCLAAIWKNGRLTALGALPGGNNAQAYGLNNYGQVVGFSENGVRDSTCSSTPSQVLRFKPVIWGPQGEIHELPLPLGDTVGFAFGINNSGQAVGTSGVCSKTSLPPVNPDGQHAVLWERDGSPTILGTLGGAAHIVATSINNLGEVAGNSEAKDGTIHPFVWTRHTGIQDLGTFPGAFVTVAPCCDTINDRGEVVGFSIDATGTPHAFLWRDKVLIDLNDLVVGVSPLHLLFSDAINDGGEIAGVGVTSTGEMHAFLATPRRGEDGRERDGKSPVVLSEHVREMLRQRLPFGRRRMGPH
jgi:probable HAF family extracellular repeat protein